MAHSLKRWGQVEEISEAFSVVISLGGTMAAAETTRLIQYLMEKGLIENAT